jgi:hypothetical protein
LVIYALSFQSAHADGEPALGRFWGVYGLLNGSNWEGLGDVQPLGRGGPFETTGHGLDLGGYVSVAKLGSVWVLAGGELGLLGFNSDVIFESNSETASTESAFEVNRLSASVLFRFGQPGNRYLDLGIGLGQYYGDTKYVDCSVIVRCFGAETSDSTTGVYLEVSGTLGKGVLVGARIHQFEFDPIEAVDLGAKRLEGPMYTLFIGWEFSNWRRN